jgi:DNA-binding transcriptional LysR family regulator
MDKLRAIEYFIRAAEKGSFSAAARSLDVSTPAVTQLVAALERVLGVVLLNRTTQGLRLTADGERYLEVSRRAAADLREIEQRMGAPAAKPRGTLTIGLRETVAHRFVMPQIARFLARYPDVEIVAKSVLPIEDIEAKNVDLSVIVGSPPERDFVVRPLAQSRFVVCAAPEYWMRAGRPHEPGALRDHHCVVFRNTSGVWLDRWTFERGDERRTVHVPSRLRCESRMWMDAALAGAGVIRVPDIFIIPYLASGALVPVLTDWEALEAPMFFALYRPRQRHSRLVRAFVDFLVEVFAEVESRRPAMPAEGSPRGAKPARDGHARGRPSRPRAGGRGGSA